MSENAEQPIRFEPHESCPPLTALVVGLQGAALVLAPTVLVVAISVRASGLDDRYLTWGMFAALLVNAAVTALNAIQTWRIGGGHTVIVSSSPLFIGIMVAANTAGGPATLASLLVVSSLVQIALAWWLPVLRRIITPVVMGTVLILFAVTILPIAFDGARLPGADAGPNAGPIIAGASLLVSVLLTLTASGRLRLFAPVVSIVAGCLFAWAFGVIDAQRIAEAGWFGIPAPPAFGFDLAPGREFWALLPSFAIMTLVLGIGILSASVVTVQTSRRRARAIDFRQVQGMVTANGLGMLLAGLAGAPPTGVLSSIGLTLVQQTGVASRRVGFAIALVFVGLAFCAKFRAVLLTIPEPVLAAYLMLALGLFFVAGFRTILQDGVDAKQAMVVAVSLSLGIGMHEHPVTTDLLGEQLGGLLGNGVMLGALAAITMTLAIQAAGPRRARLEVGLEMASLPAIDAFLERLARDQRWSEASSLRLRAAGEEALASLVAQEPADDAPERPRLVVRAHPQSGQVELEFVAAASRVNVEDQLALISDATPAPNVDELSLRLLRHHASVVRHQQFHDVDVLTIWVEARV